MHDGGFLLSGWKSYIISIIFLYQGEPSSTLEVFRFPNLENLCEVNFSKQVGIASQRCLSNVPTFYIIVEVKRTQCCYCLCISRTRATHSKWYISDCLLCSFLFEWQQFHCIVCSIFSRSAWSIVVVSRSLFVPSSSLPDLFELFLFVN